MASYHNIVPPYTKGEFRLNAKIGGATEQGLLSSLAEGIQNLLTPLRVAPDETFSRPIAVPDLLAGRRDPRATTLAVIINLLALAGILWVGTHHVETAVVSSPAKVITLVDPIISPSLPKAPPKAITMSGGGGQPMPKLVARGTPPKLQMKPTLVTAIAPPKITPRLAMERTINVQPDLKMARADVPTLGMANAAPAVVASMGNGSSIGLGAGTGTGLGSGSGGNFGGGVFKIGGGVTKPEIISAPDPGFTEEARQARVSGKVMVYLQVNPEGRPLHVKVIHGLGMGLDEKAVAAVREYRFRPATRDGHPVTVEMNVEVNFQIL